MMAQCDGLCGLEVREARHHGFCILAGATDQSALQASDQLHGLVECAAGPEAEIGDDLVIARSRRVQSACGFANQLLQARFAIHMNVFELPAERERSVP